MGVRTAGTKTPPRITLTLEDWTPASLNRIMYAPPRIVSKVKHELGRTLYYLAYAAGYRPARDDYYRHVRWSVTFAVRRTRDTGNFEKVLNDGLKYSGLVRDDNDRALDWDLHLIADPGPPGVEVELW